MYTFISTLVIRNFLRNCFASWKSSLCNNWARWPKKTTFWGFIFGFFSINRLLCPRNYSHLSQPLPNPIPIPFSL